MSKKVGDIVKDIQKIGDLSSVLRYTRISSKEDAQKFAEEFSECDSVIIVPSNDFTNLAFYAMEHCRFLEGLCVKDPRYEE